MWLPLSLSYALLTSLHIPTIKILSQKRSVFCFIFINSLFVMPLLTILLLINGLPKVNLLFYFYVAVASLIDFLAYSLAVWSFKHFEISLVSPSGSFSPLLVTLFGFLFLSETVSLQKILAIILIVVGAYFLNVSTIKSGLLRPFKQLFLSKGVRYFIFANILWSLYPIFQKKALMESFPASPLYNSLLTMVFLAIFSVPFLFFKKEKIKINKKDFLFFVLSAVIVVLQLVTELTSYYLTNVGFSTAVFKTSILFTVIWGKIFFKEAGFKERIFGTSIMLLGIVILALT